MGHNIQVFEKLLLFIRCIRTTYATYLILMLND